MRVPVNTTLERDLYKAIQIKALELSTENKKIYANDLIEEGMQIIIERYRDINKDSNRGMKSVE
jgi:hypothetical protein